MDPTQSIFSSSSLKTLLAPYILSILAVIFHRDLSANPDVQAIVMGVATAGALGLHALVLWVRGRMHLAQAAAVPVQSPSYISSSFGPASSTVPPGVTVPLAEIVAEHEANAAKAAPKTVRKASRPTTPRKGR